MPEPSLAVLLNARKERDAAIHRFEDAECACLSDPDTIAQLARLRLIRVDYRRLALELERPAPKREWKE